MGEDEAGLPPMEARAVAVLPDGPGWQYEPKWDGFRCLAVKAGGAVELLGKSGKPLGRYFPEVVEMLRAVRPDGFVLDGELIVPEGATLSFEALQARLHPAESRIRRLAAATPARLMLFDALTLDGTPILDGPLTSRRAALERLHGQFGGVGGLPLSPYTHDRGTAAAWLAEAGGALDGVVAKRLDAPYRPGRRDMLKVKRLRTADCVVGGFRRETGGREVASLLLGLYGQDGRLDHVGFTSGLAAAERPTLTRRLDALIEPPGFDGRAPGGPSRWATERSADWHPLRPELVVEVRFDHVSGDRFRHGTRLLRWRPDKPPRLCTKDQLGPVPLPEVVLAGLEGG